MYNDLPRRRLNKLLKLLQAEQMKIVTKRSKTQFHSSHANSSSADEGTGVSPGVPNIPTYRFEDEQISWKSSAEDDDEEVSISKHDDDDAGNQDDDCQEYDGQDDEGQDDVNKQTESDNDGDDFVYPKFSIHDQEERQDEENKQEEGSDLRVQIPSYYESTNDEESDEETQGANVKGEEMDEEETNEEEEVNELYRDVNVNLEGRDTEMTDAPLNNVQGTQVTEDTYVIITAATPKVQQQSSFISSGFISNMLNPNPNTGIDAILNMNTESTSLVDVPLTLNVEIPPSSITTLPPPPIPFSPPQQQTPFSTPTIAPNKLRSEAQADNEDFINKIDENMKKIIKEQVKTSHAIAVNLSEFELKKILIDKMENNKSIQQKTLYKALVDAYETDKDILDTYGDTVMFKIRRDDKDEDEEPSARSNRGSKKRRAGKEPESTSAPKVKTSKSSNKSKEGSKSHHMSTGKFSQAEEPIHADEDMEELAHQEFNTGFTEDQPVDETTQHHDWFQKLTKPPTPNRDWNKTFPAAHEP
ncbi:hypothetical protein Tco_1469613, partial [Tanacetum coccineum]